MDVAQELIGVEGVRRQAAASSYPVHPESTARHTEEPICRDAFRTS
jgi:5-deoxy-D-glucuronate isomerase